MEFLSFTTREKSLIIAGASFAIASFILLVIFLLLGSPARQTAEFPEEATYEEKMALLQSLSAIRTGPEMSEAEKEEVLGSVASDTSLSDEEKRKVLESLRTP
jgi:hypothetical protein